MGALKESQMRMARYLRDPATSQPPGGVEPRRLKIYEDLIYRNIESFISSGFPVLRSLYADEPWAALVRRFIDKHRCQTPYFLEISQEFVQFLLEDYEPTGSEPPFLAELAHYEWVELALDISEKELPDPLAVEPVSILAATPTLSPLAWVLRYAYPVHRIGVEFQPGESTGPTYLAVYRDRNDAVQFMELNAATARLLELVRDNESQSVEALLERLATELNLERHVIVASGLEQLSDFLARSIVILR